MSELIEFQTRQLPVMRVIGKPVYPKMDMKDNPIPAFWGKCFSENAFLILENLSQYHLDSAYVGFMCDWSDGNEVFTYLCGMLMTPDCPVPEGYVYRDFPASTAAVGWIRGPEKDNYKVAHKLTQEELEKQGYRVDKAAKWCMELYNCPRFTEPKENGDVILDYYIPCVPTEA